MPLLLIPAQPLPTLCGLTVNQAYAIVDEFTYNRKKRLATFSIGYYLDEVASLPDSSLATLSLPLPLTLNFQLAPGQIGQLGDPTEVLEAYAQSELLPLLGAGATIENVP